MDLHEGNMEEPGVGEHFLDSVARRSLEAEPGVGEHFLDSVARRSSAVFYVLVAALVSWHARPLFFVAHKKLKRNHSNAGLTYLLLLSLGFLDCMGVLVQLDSRARLCFDVSLGVAGIVLTLTAASDFKSHMHVTTNVASGTLDAHATVTYGEMIEHSFYQLLNLSQVVYLHAAAATASALARPLLLLAVTLPWAWRSRFPINRFSDNYNKLDPQSSALVRTLYRVKKYQYVFYKAFLLHGLNVSVALRHSQSAVLPINPCSSQPFRLYWLLLNTAYVMEFFLQTLVKKGRLSQPAMLALNGLLMLASTCAALPVLGSVLLPAAALSLALNFACRGADVPCTLLVYFFLRAHVCG